MDISRTPAWFDEKEIPWLYHYIAAAQGNILAANSIGVEPAVSSEKLNRLRAHYGIPVTESTNPVVAPKKYALFSDMGGDPDDQQSLRRLMVYPEITPSKILVQNGDPAINRVDKAIRELETDYPRLSLKLAGLKNGDYWRSVLHSSKYSTTRTDFKDIANDRLQPGEQAFVDMADAHDGLIDVWVWGPATEVAHILWKRLDLGAKMRIISIGAWNKVQDESAHQFLSSAKKHLGGWINLDTQFRGMYCNYSGNRAFVEKIKSAGALGRGYWTVSGDIDTGAFTMKEGDTPTFFASLPVDYLGALTRDSQFPNVFTDDKNSRQCGYNGAGHLIASRDIWQLDFLNRIS